MPRCRRRSAARPLGALAGGLVAGHAGLHAALLLIAAAFVRDPGDRRRAGAPRALPEPPAPDTST
jgi:hypothetical protein